jgi:hypothetical protein
MLFLSFWIVLIIGIILFVIAEHVCDFWELLFGAGAFLIIISAIAIVTSLGVIACNRIGAEAKAMELKERYNSLVYQLENELYDNDNDLGKKELYDEIREWNEDLAYHKNAQNDSWIGIFYPKIFDQLEFIVYPEVVK